MHVLISGASVAGPTLAFWLQRNGIQTTVVERAPALREGGYPVDIRGAALTVVDRMGLRSALHSLRTDTLSNSVVNARGRRFGRTERGFGVIDPDDIEIDRGSLVRVLHDATCQGGAYRFGDSIASLEQREDGVAVTFASGQRGEFDAVVGADGVHSRTRLLAFGDEAAFVKSLGLCMAIFTVPNFLGLDREQLLFNGAGRIASVKSSRQNRELKVVVFFTTPESAFDPEDISAHRKLVADAFEGAGWEFPRLLAGMREAEDFYCDTTCQVRMAQHYRGRVGLVGDAAYCPSPLSGQGSSLALVGAYVLGNALGASRDVAFAFGEYERTIGGFAKDNQDVGLKIGRGFAPSSNFSAGMRNVFLRALPYLPGTGLMMKLAMGGVRRASLAIDLGADPMPHRDTAAEPPRVLADA
jgi:2-polyprenyl-6-methoxyphenol hydroxylase-like FAD-dependent oxidoreductase